MSAVANKPAFSTILGSFIYLVSSYSVTIIIAGFFLVCLGETLTFLTSSYGNFSTKAAWLLFLFISSQLCLIEILGPELAFYIMRWLLYGPVIRLLMIAFNALVWLFDCRVMKWATGGWSFKDWFEKCWAVRWLDEWLQDV